MFSGKLRRFNSEWYKQKHGNWLEYNVKKDKVYCLYCYLFPENRQNDAFVSEGMRCWQKIQRFDIHAGNYNSPHYIARKKGEDLIKLAQSIQVAFDKQTDKQKNEYRIRLSASVKVVRAFLNGGLPFRGHNESEDSLYRGHFIEFLKVMGDLNEDVGNVILSNALGNCQLIAPSIQKEICNCFAQEVLKKIFEELGDDVFSILVDESRDVSNKEQMDVVLRYVNKLGFVKERYIGLVNVKETTALCLKYAIDGLLARFSLSMSRVRGQGYDGASNMSGEFNDLKALILKENSSAYFVHCFAHQLQLVVVGLATKHHEILKFFREVSDLVNVVCASCKRINLVNEKQRESLGLNSEIETGSGKNQELSLARPGDTRLSSHDKTLLRLISLYPIVIEVLEYVEDSGSDSVHQSQANELQVYMKTFSFVFYLHLMKHILGVTNTLCESVQRKDQNILNACGLVMSMKKYLQDYRLDGFDSLLRDVTSFCEKYDIEVVKMEDEYVDTRSRRRKTKSPIVTIMWLTISTRFLIGKFKSLETAFSEVSTKLLMCMSSLSRCHDFRAFNKLNLLNLAEMNPYDFNFDEKDKLIYELGHYIASVKEDTHFANLNEVSNLAQKMVETSKNIDYPLVYRLFKLSLVLPVATASVERSFSSMKHVKTELRNRMGDGYMNDCCFCYIENEFFQQVSLEDVMQRFQTMKTRRQQL